MDRFPQLREAIRALHVKPDVEVLEALGAGSAIGPDLRAAAGERAEALVRAIRTADRPGLMELFLAEYGLSTEEGVALMCLAEAFLRVPDAPTMDALIEDKIAPSQWGAHLGGSSSSLVNASTWALMLTGKVLQDEGAGVAAVLRGAIRRLGEPVIRTAVRRAMKEMGGQFVLGQTIDEAWARGRKRAAAGYTHSFDMLGEAAMTAADADAFDAAYRGAIARLARECRGDVRDNPGISVKLSALHPRYEETQRDRVMAELVPRVSQLARMARKAGMGFNIDAEEADRLELSLDVIAAVLRDPALAGWDGFGVVVQAYGKRAGAVLDWLYALATHHDRRLMVRLVKGAYWDSEIKRAQVEGLPGFPVFAQKAATDVSYLYCAEKLLGMTDRIYPQFATHNAHSATMIAEMADQARDFEFQRLHGMGEELHDRVMATYGTRCRIYAPVGAHRDLLAYLVRRLLENGANSSFVNQVLDADVPAAQVVADPFARPELGQRPAGVRAPRDLFAPERVNSTGFDLHDPATLALVADARAPWLAHQWQAGPAGGAAHPVLNPADPGDQVGTVRLAGPADVAAALDAARVWQADPADRAAVLTRAADLYEAQYGELFALLAREAGKTPDDAVAELREAVDFLRYYAAQTARLDRPARGVFTCISPWNFPLAIFTGQIAAALAAGNGVLAKPAEATGLIAARAVALLHQAGVPADALQVLPGTGTEVGAALVSDPRVAGVAFTGSTATAQHINRAMAAHLDPAAPLIAETGGINAMIVDSTALPEQAVRDVVLSAFRSAGQRCSALRMLYVQEDVADSFLTMLYGAMEELRLGDPWQTSCDLGPVIDARAQADITAYIDQATSEGRLLHQIAAPQTGYFVPPTVLRMDGLTPPPREVFGPVLHVATFRADQIDAVVDAVNATGYGLTFGMHSRIDDRIEQVTRRIRVGNTYINRNQIGAVVGSQPFGGEGLSGTGPKAGGPSYLPQFCRADDAPGAPAPVGQAVTAEAVQALIDAAPAQPGPLGVEDLPGPTGESNRLSRHPRGTVLCLGAEADAAAARARAVGCGAVVVAPGAMGPGALDGVLPPDLLAELTGIAAVACRAPAEDLRALRQALAARDGALIPLLSEGDIAARCQIERHLCIDTTAAGGNASLLAAVS